MQLPRLSLTVKYRLLFGTAVLLIVGAALAVPWVLMTNLILEQPYLEAQRIADDHFRLVLHGLRAGESPGGGGGVGAVGELTLLPERNAARSEFVRQVLGDGGVSGLEEPLQRFALRALRRFAQEPKRENLWELTRDSGRTPLLRYAHAVRANNRCLTCHEEGKIIPAYQENQLAGAIVVSLPAPTSDEQILVGRLWLIGSGTLAGFLAILVFYIITHRFMLAPINELRSVATNVTEGDLDRRSTLRTGDEFQDLSESFNTMLDRLRSSQEELKRANALLDQKLVEMAERNVSLYESDRLKSEFIANVSHELRTPLSSIIGFAELLRESPAIDPNSKSARYAENILISGRILLEIINDLLDLAKIEARKVELHIETFQPAELCNALIEFMRPQADKKQLDFGAYFADELPEMTTDRGRVQQILFNLLSNAIKFSPSEGGRVQLAARRMGPDHVRFAVIDNGPGVPPEYQHLIFEKFRQVDQSATRPYHGTGLGLSIARELAQLLGGEIGLDSQPGQGATFWVTLPVRLPAGAGQQGVSPPALNPA